MIQKDILRRLLAGFCVLQFFVLLVLLTRYSYRVKELLVCWLLFCSLFALLSLMFLGVVLACSAGEYLVKWVSVANEVIPELAVCPAEFPPEAISGPRILVAGTIKLAADPCAVLSELDLHSGVLIEIVSPAEKNVSN